MQSKLISPRATFGALLREARGKLALRKVSAASGLSAGYILDLELGRRLASNDAVKALASALGVDPSEMLAAVARERIAKLEAEIREQKELLV